MAEVCASESSTGDSDQDFDPTAEMLVNDFDDERTLDEEEALENAEGVNSELNDLQKDADLPLEDLFVMYGYGAKTSASAGEKVQTTPPKPPSGHQNDVMENNKHEEQTLPEETIGETPAKGNQPFPASHNFLQLRKVVSRCKGFPRDVGAVSGESCGFYFSRSVVSHGSDSSASETDDEYLPDDDWRKTIQVGSDFQAAIPEGLCKYDDAPAYENEDRLLWDPSQLLDSEVEMYLHQAQQLQTNNSQGVNTIPLGSHIRDDEQALFLLLQCGHNVEEALRRRRMQPVHPADTMSLWSEEECRSFENGLRLYGKDFHMIQQNKVRTRSVGELVQFYYLWKKTERHDVFASKNRLEKKKYALHPGTTDYMDRFLDEQENASVHRDRSSSPSVQSLMFGDQRRHQVVRSVAPSPTAQLKCETLPDVTHNGTGRWTCSQPAEARQTFGTVADGPAPAVAGQECSGPSPVHEQGNAVADQGAVHPCQTLSDDRTAAPTTQGNAWTAGENAVHRPSSILTSSVHASATAAET